MSIKKTLGLVIGIPVGLFTLAVIAESIHMSNQTPEQQATEHCQMELPNGDPYNEQKACELQYLISYNYSNVYKPKYK